jgi:hypothetical protein
MGIGTVPLRRTARRKRVENAPSYNQFGLSGT